MKLALTLTAIVVIVAVTAYTAHSYAATVPAVKVKCDFDQPVSTGKEKVRISLQ